MISLPADVPTPQADAWELEFWAHCIARRLMFQSCAACGRVRHPPMPFCPACRSTDVRWREADGDARLFTWTVVHHPSHPSLVPAVPYIVAVVEFSALDHVRLLTNLVGVPADAVRIGMALSLVWEEPKRGVVLPRFTAAGDAS